MNLSQLNFYGDPNIGMYVKASDKFCLSGNIVPEHDEKELVKFLGVKVKKALIAGTDFIGLFSAMNSNGILLSKLVTDNEMKRFKKIADEFGVNLSIIESKFSALGNLVLCNDSGAVVSKLFGKRDLEKIKDCLNVEVVQTKIAHADVVGSCGVATNKGCLLHRDTSEKEIELVGEVLKVDADIGTANFGSPFVGSCLISNSNGTLMGDRTTAPEMQRIVDTLKLE